MTKMRTICANCVELEDKLDVISDIIGAEIDQIESDPRYHYKSALVQVKAPLALEQTVMGAKMEILKKLKKLLEHE
jgi:hypothetical protein